MLNIALEVRSRDQYSTRRCYNYYVYISVFCLSWGLGIMNNLLGVVVVAGEVESGVVTVSVFAVVTITTQSKSTISLEILCGWNIYTSYIHKFLQRVSAGLGLHFPGSVLAPVSPGIVSAPVSLQVVVLDPESSSPSSHWKVATAPTVVLDTLTVPVEGNSGIPQSTTYIHTYIQSKYEYYE